MHQTGRSNGTNKARVHLNGGMAQEIYSSAGSTSIYTDTQDRGLTGSPGLAVGASEHVDIGGSLELGTNTSKNSVGARLYVKDMLTDRQSRWAFSLLPAVTYMHGSNGKDDYTGSTMTSHLMAFELHGPLSYHLTRHFAVFAEPQLILALVAVPFTAGPNETSMATQTHHETWLGEGLGAGLELGPFVPEISILHLGQYTHWLGGLGLSF
jgi:hypothetical protein